MPRNPNPAKRCTLPTCDRPHEALGLCRRHYRRYRRHGNPQGSGRPGGVVSTPRPFLENGLTKSQIRYWVDKGLVRAPVDPVSRVRRWDPEEVRVAILIHHLTQAGLPLPLAAVTARRAVENATSTHFLAPGVWLNIDLRKATR